MTETPADLLRTIVAATRRVVEVRRAAAPAPGGAAGPARHPDGAAFAAALRRPGDVRVIAECKRRSPSRGILREAYDPAAHAQAYEAAGAAAISVLTEPTFFDGLPDHLAAVRRAVPLPILRKDFIVSEYQLDEAAALGADAVLLIAAALEPEDLARLATAAGRRGLAALVEVHDEAELRVAADIGARLIGVNCRNLRTLAVDLSVHERIARAVPPGVTRVAESGIRSRADLDRLARLGYHAVLVGERLITAPDPGWALRELTGA